MKCDDCTEEYEEMPRTKCGLILCPLCWDDHKRHGCDECAWEAGFEAADYDRDKRREG